MVETNLVKLEEEIKDAFCAGVEEFRIDSFTGMPSRARKISDHFKNCNLYDVQIVGRKDIDREGCLSLPAWQ